MSNASPSPELARDANEALRLWACQGGAESLWRGAGEGATQSLSPKRLLDNEWPNAARSSWRRGRQGGGSRLAAFFHCLRFAALSIQASPLSGPHNSSMIARGASRLIGEWVWRSARQAAAEAGGPAWTWAQEKSSQQREDEAFETISEALSPRWAARKRAAPWALVEPEMAARKLYATLTRERMKGWITASCGGRLKRQIQSDLALASEPIKERALKSPSPAVEEVFALLDMCGAWVAYRPRPDLPSLFEMAQSYARA